MYPERWEMDTTLCCCGEQLNNHVNWGTPDNPKYGACPRSECSCKGFHTPTNHHKNDDYVAGTLYAPYDPNASWSLPK